MKNGGRGRLIFITSDNSGGVCRPQYFRNMKFSELSIDVQERLNENRKALVKQNTNTAYRICLYNADGTRYFSARRVCQSWQDNKGHYMPFGGGTSWVIYYGCVQIKSMRNPMGQIDYELCNGKTYGKSANGTIIPTSLPSKKDVIDLINAIGIFTL